MGWVRGLGDGKRERKFFSIHYPKNIIAAKFFFPLGDSIKIYSLGNLFFGEGLFLGKAKE